jgi:hypothetical protein
MATPLRPKDIPAEATSFADVDEFILDSSANGTRRITGANVKKQIGDTVSPKGVAETSDLANEAAASGASRFVTNLTSGGLFKAVNGGTVDNIIIFASATSGWTWQRINSNYPSTIRALPATSDLASEVAADGYSLYVSAPSDGGNFRAVEGGTVDGVDVFASATVGWTWQRVSSNLLELQSFVDKAEEWAENPEDTPVETGQFSALHHAAKAAGSATLAAASETAAEAAQSAAETASLAAGAYPTTAAGLAATSNGEYFWAESGGILTLYLNDGGSASSQSITLLAGDAFDTIFIPAIQLSQVLGTDATFDPDASSRLPMWLMPTAVVSYLGCPIRLPAHWNTFLCDFIYVNTSSSSGDVSLTCSVDEWAIGETINTTPTGAAVIDTVSSTAWISNIATLSGALACDPSKYMTIRIARNGTSGSDTLANSIGLIGINFRRAS